jgi:glycogen operon protein
MQMGDWNASLDALGVLLVGEEIDERDDRGNRISGNSFLLLLNGGANSLTLPVPDRLAKLNLQVVLDTAAPEREGDPVAGSFQLTGHSAAVILLTRPAA